MAIRQSKSSSFGKTATPSYSEMFGLIYARVSSKRQELEGHGRESQEERCKQDLRSMGVPYVRTFPDTFSGGGDFMKRPAMREMLDYIDKNPHKKFVVVFDDLKRFARDVEFHLKLRAAFKARDVLLRCLNFNFEDTPEGEFAETIMAAQGELERKQNRRQVVQKMRARLELGYWPFGAKRGYSNIIDTRHGKLSVPNKEGMEILKPAMEAFANGTFVRVMDLARHLVSKGFWKCAPEKCAYILSQMLRDPFYVGDIEYPQWEVSRRKGQHQGLIDLDTYNLIQKRLRKEALGTKIRLDMNPDFPLRGLLTCDGCGEHITAGWSKRHTQPYYICHNKSCAFYGKSLRRKDVEDRFYAILKQSTLKPSVGRIVQRVFDNVWHEEIDALKKDSEAQNKHKIELEEKGKQLTELILKAKTEAMHRLYESQAEDIANKLQEFEENQIEIDLSVPYRTALETVIGLLQNPHVVWPNLSLSEQHHLFYFIFEQKLPYHITEGYRTDKIPCATRLFEEFATKNTNDVEMARIERACRKDLRKRLQCLADLDPPKAGHKHASKPANCAQIEFPVFQLRSETFALPKSTICRFHALRGRKSGSVAYAET